MRYDKGCQLQIQESLDLIADWMQRFFYHISAYYDPLLPIGSHEITKRLQMLLNNPQCGRGKEEEIFLVR